MLKLQLKKLKHLIFGIKLGMGMMTLVLFGLGFYGVAQHYTFVHENGMVHGKITEVFLKLDPYVEKLERGDKVIAFQHVKDASVYVVKENDKYVIKKAR